jgi:hypothetical protein
VFKQMWMPALGLRGYFVQHMFRHVAIVGCVGGGGIAMAERFAALQPARIRAGY